MGMPSAAGYWESLLVDAVKNGSVAESRVTDMATRYDLSLFFSHLQALETSIRAIDQHAQQDHCSMVPSSSRCWLSRARNRHAVELIRGPQEDRRQKPRRRRNPFTRGHRGARPTKERKADTALEVAPQSLHLWVLGQDPRSRQAH